MTTHITTISGPEGDGDELREEAFASAADELDTDGEPDTEEEEESDAQEEHEVEVEYDPKPWGHHGAGD